MEMEMEMEMEFTSMVIEVKYGDTFKRFDAPINESGELDLDLAGLRDKISGLFSLPSDGEHILTHVIEFGHDKGDKDFMLVGDKYLSNAATRHLCYLKAAHYRQIINQFERRGKRCRTESTTGDSKAKEDGEVFKVECKVRDETSLLPQVIEVKYGDTLNRFNARVDESGELDLDFAELRAKICGLLSLPSEAKLALTYFDKDGDVFTIANDKDLLDVALLKKYKLEFSDSRQEIKESRELLSRGELNDSEPEAKKDEEVFNLKCEVRATQKCQSEDKNESSSLHQVKKVKWYDPFRSSDRFKELEKQFIEEGEESLKGIDPLESLSSKGRCTELEKRLLEVRKDADKANGELRALLKHSIEVIKAKTQHFVEEKEATVQFCNSLDEFGHSILSNDGKMSKLYRQMLQTTLEMCMEVPETPEEFIEKCKLIKSNVEGFQANAFKASRE